MGLFVVFMNDHLQNECERNSSGEKERSYIMYLQKNGINFVRVKDFARSCGCTPQNIYLHIKHYKTELDGHTVKGTGRQGILLDPYACQFIRDIMYAKDSGRGVPQTNVCVEELCKDYAMFTMEVAGVSKENILMILEAFPPDFDK